MKRERNIMSDSMNETTNQKISSLLDDEQILDQDLMQSLSNDVEAKTKWARYNLVSDTLNDRYQHKVDSSWFSDLSAQLENEPTILAPRVSKTFTQKVVKQIAGLAVAASVAMLAIVNFQQTQISTTDSLSNVASIGSQQSFATSDIKPVTLRLNKATESKLSGYLVNHYEHSLSGKMQGLMPYMRMVSVTPAERIVNEK